MTIAQVVALPGLGLTLLTTGVRLSDERGVCEAYVAVSFVAVSNAVSRPCGLGSTTTDRLTQRG
ncbi:MAG: hypothetical protein HQ453_11140 [Actinobacteria bacterium]|nr:hypothetical protein [Actinomycetota bacterium]